jgi:hypothetical protein
MLLVAIRRTQSPSATAPHVKRTAANQADPSDAQVEVPYHLVHVPNGDNDVSPRSPVRLKNARIVVVKPMEENRTLQLFLIIVVGAIAVLVALWLFDVSLVGLLEFITPLNNRRP